MGSDCHVYLPPATRINDVAEVMGILAGNKPRKEPLGDPEGSWAVRVPTIKAENSSVCGCAEITFWDSNKEQRWAFYHFEPSKTGERLLSVRSTGFWIAIGKRLVDFFGGRMTYNDCGMTEDDYQQPHRTDIHESDGEPWQAFQQRIFDVKPLTKKEIKDAAKLSAYGE